MTTEFRKYSARNLTSFYSKIDDSTGCWLWQASRHSNGYGQFWHNNKPAYAHRVSLEIHLGREIQEGMVVAHAPLICHNTACVNPEHLREATYAENARDKHTDGTVVAKLNPDDIRAIRESKKSGLELAEEYSVSRTQISRIIRRIQWAHLE
jgi:hypothetical protein